MAELVDALVLVPVTKVVGVQVPPRTIGAWRNIDGVTALREMPHRLRNWRLVLPEGVSYNKGINVSMNVSETKSDGLLREYKIVITADEIDAEVMKKLEEIAATVKMPGFRPGKVPLSVVKTRFATSFW